MTQVSRWRSCAIGFCSESHRIPEMMTTRSMTRKQNHNDAPRRKRSKASGNGGSPWSNLHHDVLLLIMMRLGVVDFLAFSGVCQSWRELALPNRCRFMASRCPMSIYLSTNSKKSLVCHLDDFNDGRKFKTVLPATSARTCLGLTSGYLILFARRNRDFLLMNPITRHQLRFPSYPYYVSTDLSKIRSILVYSPSLSRWVFLITVRYSETISFSLDGGRSVWKHLVCRSPVSDLHVFRGKIYVLDVNSLLYEARLDQLRAMMPIEVKNCTDSQLVLPEFVSSGENMYVMGSIEGKSFMFQEVDLKEMKWMYPETSEEEYTLFLGEPKCATAIKPSSWDVTQKHFKMSAYLYRDYEKNRRKAGLFTGHSWYFPHECFNVNLLEE